MHFIKHLFSRHKCINNIYIDDSKDSMMPLLKCEECGREIGFIYYYDQKWMAFVHYQFKCYKKQIEKWVHEHTKDRNTMGYLSEQEWWKMLCGIKQHCEDCVLPMGCEQRSGECEEDSEGCESDRTGEVYQDGLNDMLVV